MSKPKLAVVGLGKLGAPMAAIYSSLGFDVVGLDLSRKTVESVNIGYDHISEPGYEELLKEHPFPAYLLEAGRFHNNLLSDVDAYFIVVPTPSGPDGKFVNDYVLDAIRWLGSPMKRNDKEFDVVICSTVMPGSCGGPIRKAIFEYSNKIVGVECGLVYSPEFIALGTVVKDMLNPDFVLLGSSHSLASARVAEIYKEVTDAPVKHLGLKEAELAKIAINSYITMKISFANSISILADSHPDIDTYRVCEAIGMDSRIGSKYIKPGGSYGGPCFPRDTVAFSSLFGNVGAELVDATKWINDYQIDRAAGFVHAYLKLNKDPIMSDVTLLGMSYKPGTHIAEESFGTKLKERLVDDGLEVLTETDGTRVSRYAKVVVICTPDEAYANVEAHDHQIIIDFWDLLNDGKNIVKVGKS
jgi:UDPglucose 6-dehydrogenase